MNFHDRINIIIDFFNHLQFIIYFFIRQMEDNIHKDI
jgi:hypothetical protein